MEIQDKKQLFTSLDALGELYEKTLSAMAKDIYFHALKAFTYSEVRSALAKCVSACKWFPKPAEIIEIIQGNPDQNQSTQAEIEATKVLTAIASLGSYKTPKFDDPITGYLVQSRYGWGHLCATITNDKKTWFVKEFKEAYLGFSRDKLAIPQLEDKSQKQSRNVHQLVENIGNGI